ncbi:MAG TPA: hypothetical protein V6D22_23860 [Candidatus Obscuribacterales bacterium]
MNVKTISLAVASLALMSTASAYAAGISANVGPIGAGVGVGPAGVGAGVNVGGLGAGVNVGGGYVAQPGLLGTNVITQPAVLGGLGAPTVLSYPATYTGACPTACANPCAPRVGFLGGLFGGHHTLFDVSAFGVGAKLGGYGPDLYGPRLLGDNAIIYPSSARIAGAGLTGCGINTMSAVIPNACGGSAGLNGERVGNPWLDLGLWRFGFKAGVVNPNWDMRSVGMY